MSLTRALGRTAIGALLASASVVACLGFEDDGFLPGFGGTGPSFFDAAAEQFVSHCDAIEDGLACTGASDKTLCEADEFPNVDCNGLFECSPSARWIEGKARRAECAPTVQCPAAYTEVNPNGCTVPHAGSLICEYDEGTCGCAPVAPSDAGLDEDAGDDAGDAEAGAPDAGDGGTTYEWRCVHSDRDAGCPRKRPRIGRECVRPMSCDYGTCVFEDGVTMDCYSGYWVDGTRSTECR